MNIYSFINQAINANKKKDKQNDFDFTFRPEPLYDYKVPEFNIYESSAPGAEAKRKQKLSKVLAFIDLNKQRRFSECATIMPIPVNNTRLVSITGNSMQSTRLIQYMIEIGLLSVYDNTYQFNGFYDSNNHSKRYVYYVEIEKLVKQYCEKNNINKYKETNYKGSNDNGTIVNTCKIDSFDSSQVRFGDVHLLKPDNWSVSKFEDYIYALLLQNYQSLEYYQKMADYINDTFYEDYPDYQIRYTPTFTWNKGNKAITRIGIRATNQLVSMKKEDRALYLLEHGFNLSKDVKSSVPRITISINKGEWLSEDIDVYKLVYDQLLVNQGTNSKESNDNGTIVKKFRFAEIREDLKALHLRAYFDNCSTIGRNTCHSMGDFSRKDEVYSAMLSYKSAIEDVEGYLYGSEIFFHESNIYMEVLLELLNEGYFVWQVYDSWYARKDGVTQSQYEQHVAELVEEKANNYIDLFF